MTWIPSVEYILSLYEQKIEEPILINHAGLQTTLDKVKYGIPYRKKPTIWEQVTILYKEIVENHYFHDGNKRIGVLIAYIFLQKNGYDFNPPEGEIFDVTMEVAQVKKEFDEILSWFSKNSSEL